MAFHPKAQVWKSKLQSCPEPSKSVHIMYIAHTIQVNDLIKNLLEAIQAENGHNIETSIQAEAAFQTESFYKNFNRNDEE